MNSELRKKYGLKQLNIEIEEPLLEEIKRLAKRRNIPTRTWIIRHLVNGIKSEQH